MNDPRPSPSLGPGRRPARTGVTAFLLAAAILVPPATGQEPPTPQSRLEQLRRTQALLTVGSYDEAHRAALALVDELAGSLKGGPGANELAATALAQLAVAEAGRGQTDEAVWHLQMAESFNPAFRGAPFAEFGAAGEALVAARRAAEAKPADAEVVEIITRGDLEPPRVLESRHVVFRASREVIEALDPELAVEFVIDRDGRPRRPRVRGRLDNPGAVLLSLEVLRVWRFTPPRLGGEPAAARYAVDLPRTEGAARRATWDLELGTVACLMAGERWAAARETAEELMARLAEAPPGRDRETAREVAANLLAAAEARSGA